MSETKEKAPPKRVQNPNAAAVRVAFDPLRPTEKPQEFYDNIKRKFAEERDLRLNYRPEGTAQYTSELEGELAKYEVDPYAGEATPREPINPYGWSKFVAEQMLRDWSQSDHEFAAVALRYFNVAGCAADGSLGEDHEHVPHGLG